MSLHSRACPNAARNYLLWVILFPKVLMLKSFSKMTSNQQEPEIV